MKSQLNFQKKEIIFRLLGRNQRMTDFLFDPDTALPCLRECPKVLLEESWELSNEEKILVLVALDVWSGQGNVFLWELFKYLRDENLNRVIVALTACRKLYNPTGKVYHEGNLENDKK